MSTIEEELQFLSEHTHLLRGDSQTKIRRMYQQAKRLEKMHAETNETMKEARLTHDELRSKVVHLDELFESLSVFSRKKGLKDSLFKVEELLAFIDQERNDLLDIGYSVKAILDAHDEAQKNNEKDV